MASVCCDNRAGVEPLTTLSGGAGAQSEAEGPASPWSNPDRHQGKFPFSFVRDCTNEITRAMRKKSLLMSLVGYLLYLFLVLVIYYIGTDASHVYDLETIAPKLARVEDGEWGEMHTLEEFWTWLQTKLLPQFYQTDLYSILDADLTQIGTRSFPDSDTLGPVHMYRYNLIVGAMRIQQKRVKVDDCSIPAISYRAGDHCYTELSSDSQQMDTWAGPSSGTNYSFSEDDVGTWWGTIPGQWATYGPGGYNFDFVPNQTTAEWTGQLNQLKNDIWLGYPTRMVTITINSYNGGLNMWSNNQFQFEFSASGVIYKKIQTRTFTTGYQTATESLLWRNIFFGLLFWFTLHYLINVIVTTLQDAHVAVAFRKWADARDDGVAADGCCTNCCRWAGALWDALDTWRLLDLVISAFLIAWFGIRVSIASQKNNFAPVMDTDEFVDSSTISSMVAVSNQLMGFNMFIMLLKVFKFMEINKRLATIWRTLKEAKEMLLYFCLQFGLLFIGFAFWGHVTFGSDMEAFATPIVSVNTAVDMLIGNGDIIALYRANRVMGPLFYSVFTVVMTLIIVNVFIAIICESYSSAYAETNVKSAFPDRELYNTAGDWLRGSLHGLLDYLHKLALVCTLNLCFTSGVGINTSAGCDLSPPSSMLGADEQWSEVPMCRRVLLVLWSTMQYMLEIVFMCRVTGTGQHVAGSTKIIYKNRMMLKLALDHLEKSAEPADTQLAVDSAVMVRLFGLLRSEDGAVSFMDQYDRWNGPPDQRFEVGSADEILKEKLQLLNTALNQIKSKLQRKLTKDGVNFASYSKRWEEQMKKISCAVDWQQAGSDWQTVGVEALPLDLMWQQESVEKFKDSAGVMYEGELVTDGDHEFVDSEIEMDQTNRVVPAAGVTQPHSPA